MSPIDDHTIAPMRHVCVALDSALGRLCLALDAAVAHAQVVSRDVTPAETLRVLARHKQPPTKATIPAVPVVTALLGKADGRTRFVKAVPKRAVARSRRRSTIAALESEPTSRSDFAIGSACRVFLFEHPWDAVLR